MNQQRQEAAVRVAEAVFGECRRGRSKPRFLRIGFSGGELKGEDGNGADEEREGDEGRRLPLSGYHAERSVYVA